MAYPSKGVDETTPIFYQKHSSNPKLEFDQPVEMLVDQVIKLEISEATGRSSLPEYADSIFSYKTSSRGDKPGYIYIVTRKKAPPREIQTAQFAKKVISSEPIPLKRPLIIKNVTFNPTSIDSLDKLARTWKTSALEKRNKKSKNSPHIETIFWDSFRINKLIAECMAAFNQCHNKIFDRAFVGDDTADSSETQVIALTGDIVLQDNVGRPMGKYLKITHMATNPKNVRCNENQNEPNRVEGAASQMIAFLAQLSLREKFDGIYLESIQSAKLFYEKVGFENLDSKNIQMFEADTFPMLLTSSKILSLFEKGASLAKISYIEEI